MTIQAAADAEVSVSTLIIVEHGAKLVLNVDIWTILRKNYRKVSNDSENNKSQ